MKKTKKNYVNRWLKSALCLALALVLVLTMLSTQMATAVTSGGTDALQEETEASQEETADYDAGSVTYASDEVIIVYADSDEAQDAEDAEIISAAEEITTDDSTDGTAVLAQLADDISVEEAIEILEEDPAIDYVQPNYSYSILTTTEEDSASVSSDASEDTQYYLYSSAFTDAWEYAASDGSVTVAVLDTGCNLTHEDLAENLNTALAYDVTTGTLLSESDVANNGDAMGHGTYVCGVISAVADNGTGIAGASYNATILPVKVFDSEGECTTADLIAAYAYLDALIESGELTDLKVINMSIGYYSDGSSDADTALETVIADMLEENGVLTVCAGGNSGSTDACYPADFDVCVSVTAVNAAGENASFSDYNDAKDISAYGVDIYTTSADGGYTTVSGTSVAAPQVAAAAALLWAADATLTASEVVSLLQETSTEIQGNLHEETMDNGIVNAGAAVAAALGIDASAAEEAEEAAQTEDTAAEEAAEAEESQADASEEEEKEAEEDAEDAAEEEETALEIEEDFSSWRYSDGQVIEHANTDSDAAVSTLADAYSTWVASYGTSYLGIVSGSTTTKVAISGVSRIVIDVSKWQGEIDWEAVADAGITSAIIRCGYGQDYTSQDDAYFLQNVEGALENGIEIGVYLYSYATSTTAAAGEAAHVLRLLEEAGLNPDDLDLPVFLDMENDTQAALSASTLGDIAETFCDAIEAEGFAVGIYANKNWWTNYLTDEAFDNDLWYRWVARYPTSTSVTSSGVDDTDMWQFTQSGTVDGITGSVDVSFDYLGSGSYLPSQITLNSVTLSSSLTSATIKWTAVSWADGYQIYRATGSGSYSLIKTITSGTTTSYTNSSLSLGKTYKYKVRPYKTTTVTSTVTSTVIDEETGEETEVEEEVTTTSTIYGSYSAVKSVTTYPSTVTISSAATTTAGYVKVSWKKVSNATGYVIYRSTNGGSYSKVKTITSKSTVSWTDSSVKPGRVYRYKIKAYTTSGSTTVYSTSYSSVKKVTAKPGKVTISSITSTKSRSGTVKWAKITNATGYQVAYRIKGTSKWYYTTVSTNKKVFTLLRNKNYYVKVRAYTKYNGTKYYGSWSSEKLMTVK